MHGKSCNHYLRRIRIGLTVVLLLTSTIIVTI